MSDDQSVSLFLFTMSINLRFSSLELGQNDHVNERFVRLFEGSRGVYVTNTSLRTFAMKIRLIVGDDRCKQTNNAAW